MGKAKVLVIGFKGLAAEVVKNIVLAGVGSVTILENEKVKVVDIGANFFLSKEDVGKNRVSAAYENVSELNPMMRVVVDDSNPQEKPLEFFEPFDVICLTDSNKTMIKKLDEFCRSHKKPFFAAGSLGLFSYIFTDHNEHQFLT